MTLILALETSADICAAALVEDAEVLGVRQVAMSRGHAEALVPMVQELAETTGIALTALDLIGVTRGPGSFTGVRTGIAAARGFSIASGAPAIGVSSLQAVARSVVCSVVRDGSEPAPVLCVLETRRADYFVQLFDHAGGAVGTPGVMNAEDLLRLVVAKRPILAGNAVSRLALSYDGDPDLLRVYPGEGNPDPVDVAAIARTIFDQQGVAQDTLSPLYLRAPEAKLPANGGRLKR
jgi:tRNA threonylcarbamoyladenosine biosynthesis protein TsaB